VLEQVLAISLPALVFWAYTLLFERRARLVDFLGMTGLARLPLLLVGPPLAWLMAPHAIDPHGKLHASPSLLLILVVGMLALAAHLGLLFQGFKNASGLRGARLGAGFAALVLLCEVASKAVLWRLT